jgi:hypothetical protein
MRLRTTINSTTKTRANTHTHTHTHTQQEKYANIFEEWKGVGEKTEVRKSGEVLI